MGPGRRRKLSDQEREANKKTSWVKCKATNAIRSKRWRENNPEKYQEIIRIRNEKGKHKRAADKLARNIKKEKERFFKENSSINSSY